MLTGAYRLPCLFVIHTVGPVWHGGADGEPDLLSSCYRHSLALAAERKLQSIAFPAISTGVYGYPITLAAEIAVIATREFLTTREHPAEVIFCCFSDGDLAIYESLLGQK